MRKPRLTAAMVKNLRALAHYAEANAIELDPRSSMLPTDEMPDDDCLDSPDMDLKRQIDPAVTWLLRLCAWHDANRSARLHRR